jgi:phage-related protein
VIPYSKKAINTAVEKEWEIIVINKAAEQEILKLTADVKAKFLRISDLLIKLDPANVSMPHIKHLEDKLWEMRLNGKVNIVRSIYCLAPNKKIIILHSFIKKTQKTPRKALEIAKQRMKEVIYDKI